MLPLSIIDLILDPVTKSITFAMVELGTFWVGVPTDAVQESDSPSRWLQDELSMVTVAVATVSVIIAGAKMAITAKGESAKDVLRSLLTLTIVMLLSLTILGLLIQVGDKFSECMIASSVTDGIGQKSPEEVRLSDLSEPELDGWKCDIDDETRRDFGMSMLAALGMTGPTAVLGPLMIVIIGLWALIASIFQLIMMIIRNGMLVVLIGVLPLAASATNTETGRMWFKRCVSWLVAFLLYKPIAALVYAAALKLLLSSATAATSSQSAADEATAMKNGITAAVMMTLAIIALPALMKFTAPLVAATAGGAGMMASMTGQGRVGHELVASSHDEAAGDSPGPLGAAAAGGSRASSMTGRAGATGARGPSSKMARLNRSKPSGKGAQGSRRFTTSSRGTGGGSDGGGGGGGGDGGSGGNPWVAAASGSEDDRSGPARPEDESGQAVGSGGDGPGGSMSASELAGTDGTSGGFDGGNQPEGPSGSN